MKIQVNGIRLKHVSEFIYLGCVLDNSGTDGAEKVVSGKRVAGAIRSLVNPRDLQLECPRLFHETLLVPVLMYRSETMLWKVKERSRIKATQMDNIRRLLGIRRMDMVPNSCIRELCGVKKGIDERIYEGVLRWFGHVEKMESDRIAKKVYVRECAGSRSVGRSRKRRIDTVNECLRKRGLDVRQARRMVQDMCEWRGFVRRNAWGVAQAMNP